MSSRRSVMVAPARSGPAWAMCALALALILPVGGCARAAGEAPAAVVAHNPEPRDDTADREDAGLSGRLLVASETMGDPHFRQAVIYMIEHDETGAFGLIVNMRLGAVPIAGLLERMGQEPTGATGTVAVHYGGPVEPGQGFFLHTRDVMPPGSVPVSDGVAWSAEPNLLRAIGAGEGPRRVLLAFGYAGWGPGQLESEMAEGAWFSIPSPDDLVFAARPSESWARAISLRGIDL